MISKGKDEIQSQNFLRSESQIFSDFPKTRGGGFVKGFFFVTITLVGCQLFGAAPPIQMGRREHFGIPDEPVLRAAKAFTKS